MAVLAGAFCSTLSPISANAGTFTTLYQFTGGSAGSEPLSGVVQDASGTLYGQTYQAGSTACVTSVGIPIFGCGTLYSFSTAAGLKTLVTFNGPNGAYGYYSPILVGSTLYGTALAGGATDNGVIYSVKTDGTNFRLLHQFTGTDGSEPNAALVEGPDHALYGVAAKGGPAYPGRTFGLLFKITPDGTYSILHVFNDGTDGGDPDSIVVEKSGLIIGSTFQGGNKGKNCTNFGCGVLYAYSPATGRFKVLYQFLATGNSGDEPFLGSVGPDGTVYGDDGGFFALSPRTGFTPLPATGGDNIGSGSNTPPVLGADGSLTSTQPQGPYGVNGGTLYQQLAGVLTPLHTFTGPDGAAPDSTPLLTSTGSFIGVTGAGGGPCSCGTIYEYTP